MDFLNLISPGFEVLWLLTTAFLSLLALFKKKSLLVIIGCIMIMYGYLSLIHESVISYQEVETVRWIIRIGTSFILYDTVVSSKFQSPVDRISKFLKRVRCLFKKKQ